MRSKLKGDIEREIQRHDQKQKNYVIGKSVEELIYKDHKSGDYAE